MLTPEQKTEVAVATNDSALRLYEYYIAKGTYKHFSPIDYERIGEQLGWTKGKTEKCKTMLTKAGYLLIKKDTLKDKTKVFRILLGKDLIEVYNRTKVYPDEIITLGENE